MFKNKPRFGPERFPAGADIIRQGDMPDKFYIITRGRVEVVIQPPDGLDAVVNRLGPGDFFGEVGLLKQSLRMATVRAETAVDVMVMDYQTFYSWLNGSSLVSQEIEDLAAVRTRDTGSLEPIPHVDVEQVFDDSPEATVESAEQYQPGEIIIEQGELADRFFVIVEGFVSVTHMDDMGKEHLVTHLKAGDYFGEIGLLDGGKRIATVTAVTRVKVVSFDRDTFRRWMIHSPNSQSDISETAKRRRRDTGMLSRPDDE